MNVGMEYEDILMRNQELRMLVEQLTAQRNEARKEVCLWQGLDTGKKSEEVAKVRGWDCFKEDSK